MTEILPYLNGHGYIATVLEKIKSAPTPPKFTNDFLQTKLAVTSSSARPIIPFLKKLGFIDEGNIPTERYKKFRNAAQSGKAAADGLRAAYKALYDSNEYAHALTSSDLEGLIIQVTGLDKSNQILKATMGSFNAVKAFANFDDSNEDISGDLIEATEPFQRPLRTNGHHERLDEIGQKLNISYTINLNLPETTNVEVFDAIFQSLNRNILKNDE